MDGAVLKNTVTGEIKTIETAAVFVAVGRDAQSELAGKFVNLTHDGFIQTDREMCTNVRGYICGRRCARHTFARL